MNEKTNQDIIDELSVDPAYGLKSDEVSKRLEIYGENRLKEGKTKTFWELFYDQFKSILIAILLAAAVLSIFIGEFTEGVVIMIIVILNAFVGAKQEASAGDALKALKNMVSPAAKLKRNGRPVELSSVEIVPGDIVVLEAGDYVPADMRLLETVNLKIEESALTGESVPVDKNSEVLSKIGAALGDRENAAFSGTYVAYGRGVGVVTHTGMKTEIGKIAGMLDTEAEPTPLQQRLAKLGASLGVICLVVAALIFGIGWYRGMDLMEIFMVSISLAVAAIPEGLPAIVTVVLALGMKNMVGKNVLIKNLGSVETLGSTTVICSDKTGTLTQNKMTVKAIFDGSETHEITGNGYSYSGEIAGKYSESNIRHMMLAACLCNDAKVDVEKETVIGDPTEAALLVMGAKAGFMYEEVQKSYPRLNEYPFDSQRKMMSVVQEIDGELMMYTKGAPDVLFDVCEFIEVNGEIRPFDEYRDRVNDLYTNWAVRALRVLCYARKAVREDCDIKNEEHSLILCGMSAMIDPPRDSAKQAISMCKSAGIRVIMITGDHALTASAIGRQIGLLEDDEKAISGSEIDAMDAVEFEKALSSVNVFSRVAPEHKVRIVDELRLQGNIAAMTGDGVNDAPSLKRADIGIAMGIAGTDVSKEAADMILTDDNFSSIVSAVEEGRVIYANIRKFVSYLISCNVGEIILIFTSMILGWGSPLSAIQLLWVNLITDSLPAFALGMEPRESDVMQVKPRDPKEPIVDKHMKTSIVFQSIGLAFATLLSYRAGYAIDPSYANTFALITLISGELLRAFSGRSEHFSVLKTGFFGNKILNIAVFSSYGLTALLLTVPFLRDIFGIQTIGISHLGVALLFSVIPFVFGELSKKFK